MFELQKQHACIWIAGNTAVHTPTVASSDALSRLCISFISQVLGGERVLFHPQQVVGPCLSAYEEAICDTHHLSIRRAKHQQDFE